MRLGLRIGTALLLVGGLLCPTSALAQGKAPEIIRGTKKVTSGPATPPASPAQPAQPAAKPGAEPALADASYQQGLTYLEARDYDKAIKALQQALAANPRSAEVYYSLGQAFSAQGNQDKAVKSFKAALRLKPDLTKAHVALGEIYARQGLNLLRQGEPSRAEALFKEAIAQDPKNDGAFNNLGVAQFQQGRYTQSLSSLQKSVTLNPNNSQAQFNLGVAQYSVGNKNATVQQYTILTITDPAAADELFRIIQGTSQIATPFRF
jgi:tetratricopeptide (TPR) repeat protein